MPAGKGRSEKVVLAHPTQPRAQGIVIEVHREDVYRVELSNGHRCMAKAPKGLAFSMGDKLTVEFHPYDLSRGRIIVTN